MSMMCCKLTGVRYVQLYAWGWGRYGNLGDGEKADRYLTSCVTVSLCGQRNAVDG